MTQDRPVGIVVVSHSPDVARGTADMVRQMVGEEVPLAFCGGNSEGGLGTDVPAIMAAIDDAWSDLGVAILVDLGGAELNSEMAVEMQPAGRQSRIVICDAPIVEGAVLAATEAHGGGALADVKRAAERCLPQVEAGVTDSAPGASATAEVLLSHPAGLHARPSVKLTKLAKTYQSVIKVSADSGGEWIDAKSIVRVMGAKAPRGSLLHFRATGEDADDAIAALVALVESDFEEASADATKS